MSSRPSRLVLRTPAMHSGRSCSPSCSSHRAHFPVLSWPLQVHWSASGSRWHFDSRRPKLSSSPACVARVLGLTTCRLGSATTTRGSPGARLRTDLGLGVRWHAAAGEPASRAGSRACYPCVRRAGEVRVHLAWWPRRSGGVSRGGRRKRKRVRTPTLDWRRRVVWVTCAGTCYSRFCVRDASP